jgi:hypothetical protein
VGSTGVGDGAEVEAGVQPMMIRSRSGASHPMRRRRRFAMAVIVMSSSKRRVLVSNLGWGVW